MFTKLWRRAAERTHRPSPDRGQHRSRRLGFELLEDRSLPSNVAVHWNEVLMQAIPTSTAPVPVHRNMALVSVALFDAVNAIDKSYESYATHLQTWSGASQEAAAAQAAHDTLVALFPESLHAFFDAELAKDLAGIPTNLARPGIATGREVAREILALRADDGSGNAMTWTIPNNDPGTYQLTPPNFAATGNVHVPFITPFAVETTHQFRPGPHPALGSPEYATDLNEVRVVGASNADEPGVDRDGNGLPDRTAEQTRIAERWRTPLGNVSAWNRIAQNQAVTHDLSLPETARLFALLNVAMNDGLLTSHESKFYYNLWRPITAIQWAEGVFYPDPNAWKTEHPTTPPYPAYASNASTIGGACATVLTDVFGPNVSFSVNWPSQGVRTYANYWAAADEQANARIYGGIHFRFDCVAGQQIGRDVGGYVVDNILTPRDNPAALIVGSLAPDVAPVSPGGGEAPPAPQAKPAGAGRLLQSGEDVGRAAADDQPTDGATPEVSAVGRPTPGGVSVADPADPLALEV